MTCSKCGIETQRYRIVAHRLIRDGDKVIAVENAAMCLECIEKEKSDGTDNVHLDES